MRGTERRRERRERDRAQRREAANHRVGREYAYTILFGARMAGTGLALLAGIAAWWAWKYADWAAIGQWSSEFGRRAAPWIVLAGLACLAAWMVWAWRVGGTLHNRMMAIGRGMNRRTGHLVGAAGLLLLIGGVMLWRPM